MKNIKMLHFYCVKLNFNYSQQRKSENKIFYILIFLIFTYVKFPSNANEIVIKFYLLIFSNFFRMFRVS